MKREPKRWCVWDVVYAGTRNQCILVKNARKVWNDLGQGQAVALPEGRKPKARRSDAKDTESSDTRRRDRGGA